MNLSNLLRHISLKYIQYQKAQTLLALAGISLGVAVIVLIGIVHKSVLHSFEESFRNLIDTNLPLCELYPG